MSQNRLPRLAHVVYRTRKFEQMLEWYQDVFGASIQHQNPVMAFLTYDDEHHRFAFLDLSVVQPDGDDSGKPGLVGLEHVAYTFALLDDLFENYARLKSSNILPYWCVHHGLTVPMYYADPDGNQLEFQVDSFASAEESNAYIRGPGFSANPVGVEFDPDDWLAQVQSGATLSDFLVRRVHEPVSPIRGALGEI
ncbi:biphenyl 2,3-dioxygenase [Kineobactrum sediminis]|uniref:Biphenyl 2,3-dioxygenase n=1 Tax=Kineobactrum sediminis TaxID=1905677 RepID=A0A2N5Y5J2_9GAMM|nr:VOC family protein [Kineobactrum sediminis]PLW83665.1 biphenyl 2,3-dioxygenase [Kineobactrum sediminis]